ncbi:olfactory receptor 8H1-like [Hyperolius riggenbachi]|uniref:olfactory receptor 8H1-like n=1 Tax=Hyperolius riggenbachi TaxID=752182 RepID=UPI0035A3783D
MNQTLVTQFILLGFQDLDSYRIVLFHLFLLLYIVTVSGNLLIISLVSINQSQSLSSPMYFFLSHLSTCDLLLTTVIVPLMLNNILKGKVSVSFLGCFAQLYLFGALASTECLLLAVMSYDRYVAICNPLRYSSIINLHRCSLQVFGSWFLSFSVMLITIIQIYRLDFCGPNIIDHFFCDLAPLLQLSCSDTSFVELENILTGLPLTFAPLMYITATYIAIFMAIFRIPTTIGRHKAFYTCSSHITVVSIYYGTLVVAYLFLSKDYPLNVHKALSLLYTVLTPMLNPIIYSLRNKEIKIAFLKLVVVEQRAILKLSVRGKKHIASC